MIEFRSRCPVASALDLFGDRWTLVVLRSVFAGKRTYSELAGMPEGIATNILADRLALLEREGLLRREAYHDRPKRYRYELTRRGADLLPTLQAMALWAHRYLPERWALPDWFRDGKPEDHYPPP